MAKTQKFIKSTACTSIVAWLFVGNCWNRDKTSFWLSIIWFISTRHCCLFTSLFPPKFEHSVTETLPPWQPTGSTSNRGEWTLVKGKHHNLKLWRAKEPKLFQSLTKKIAGKHSNNEHCCAEIYIHVFRSTLQPKNRILAGNEANTLVVLLNFVFVEIFWLVFGRERMHVERKHKKKPKRRRKKSENNFEKK